MATLLSLTTVGIGDIDLLLASPPCLIVNTFYVGGDAESSVTYLWQDEATGELRHELVYMQPAPFETALAWAEAHAPTRSVERIHVRHKRDDKTAAPETAIRTPRRQPVKKAAAKKAPARKAARKTLFGRRPAKKTVKKTAK